MAERPVPLPRTLLVATDFSAASRDALTLARDLAGVLAARVHLVHVIPDPARMPWSIDAGIAVFDVERQWRAQAEESLAAERVRAGLPDDTVLRVAVGDPAHEILAAAAAVRAGLVVMGTHGAGRVARLLMGSVADKVLRQTSRPVVVVPPAAAEGGVS